MHLFVFRVLEVESRGASSSGAGARALREIVVLLHFALSGELRGVSGGGCAATPHVH